MKSFTLQCISYMRDRLMINSENSYCLNKLIVFIAIMLMSAQAFSQKTWVAAGSGNWSVGSNWSGGTVPVSTDNVLLSPAAARTITVDGNFTVTNLTVGANATLSFGSTNALSVNGNFAQSNGVVNLNNGSLNVVGNFTKTGGTFNEGSGTISFNGTAAQTISVNDATRTFYNVSINNGNGVSIIAPATNLVVSNTLAFSNGKFTIGSNTLTLNGTISGMSAANSFIGSATSNMTIGGSGALGSLFFDMVTPGVNRLNVLTINRTGAGSVNIGSDLQVRTTLTLTNGLLTTGVNKLIINSTGSVSRTNGYVNGNLQKNIATGATSRTFEIGDNNAYTPVTIAFASVTAAGDLVVSTTAPLNSAPQIGSVQLNAGVAVNRFWSLVNVNTLAFTTWNGTFNFDSGDLIGSPSTSALRGGIYGSSWSYPAMGALNATNSTINAVAFLGNVVLATCAAPNVYTVTGGGAYCTGGAGSIVGLNNSETGVSYQLQLGGVNTGTPVAGTGSAISFGNQTTAGTYTVIATRTVTGCTSTMTGSVTVSINPLPTIALSGSTNVCSGTTSLTLNYTNPVNSPDDYSIEWGTAAISAGFTNTGFTGLSGGTLTVGGMQPVPGNFPVSILIRNSATGCQSVITNGSLCGTVNENQTLSLTAPSGSFFTAINFASYGTPNGSCGSFSTSSCHAINSLSIVQAAAIGQNSFSVPATNGVFGDPCSGTFKRLYVEAAYGFSISISPTLSASISGTTTICRGSITTLTAPPATNYSWNNGATSQSITVSPLADTTYTVTITNAGCSSTASQLVTVNAIPSVTITNNTPAICSGVSSVLVNYTSPLNSPDRYSITWSDAGIAAGLVNVNNAVLSGGSISLTGLTSTAGVYGATILISNSVTGCSSAISSATICGTSNEGSTLTMSAPGGARFIDVNFASYGTPTGTCGSFATSSCHAVNSLTLVRNAAIGQTSFSIAATNAVFGDPCNGTYKRLYVSATYSIFYLTVNAIPAAPVAGSNSPVCAGNTISLTANTIAGATYSWTGPGGFTSSSQNPTRSGSTIAMAGTYSVGVSVAGCSSVTTGNVNVLVNPVPSAGISYAGAPYCLSITAAQPVTLTGTTGGVFSAPAALSINASTGAITPSSSVAGGPYTVTYTIPAAGGCALFSTTSAVSILGIPAATTVTGGGTFCNSRTITASGGGGGTIYFQGTTSGGTSTAIASSSQVITSSGTYYFRSRNASGCWGTQGSVTVNIQVTPTLGTATLAMPYCAGNTAAINLTGMVPGSTNTINYSINGTAQTPVSGVTVNGSGAASFTTAVLNAGNNGQILRITGINNGTCATATFAVDVTLIMGQPNTWRGISTNWNDNQNWCGGVPPGSANITIPSGLSIYPVINSGMVQTNNISIGSGASVTIQNAEMGISGTITNSGWINASNGTLTLNGTVAAQTISGSMFLNKAIKNLKISNSNGVSLGGTNDTLKLTGLLNFGTNNAVLQTNGNLTLVSNASGTAAVGDMTNGGANSGNDIIGNVTVEKFIPNQPKAWRFLSTPTSGQTIKNAWMESNGTLGNSRPGYGTIITSNNTGALSLGFDIQTASSPSMKTYNPVTDNWEGVATTTQPIVNKKGYLLFIRGDRSVTAFNQAPTSTTLRTTGQLFTRGSNAPLSSTVLAGKLESVGNPYASVIDFTKLTKSGDIDDKFYVWDPLLTNNYNGLGGYQTISATNGWKPVPGGTANYDANVAASTIESGQAFFVYSSGNGGIVSFSETAKVNNAVSRETNVVSAPGRYFFRTYMYNAAGALTDGNVVAFNEYFSNIYDGNDALKITNTTENIGIRRGNYKFAVEARSPLVVEDTVYYSISNMRVQSYQLKFQPDNMPVSGLSAFLADKFLNTQIPLSLSDSTVVNFSITSNTASAASDRFYVVFKPLIVLPVNMTSIAAVRNNTGEIQVNWKSDNEINLRHYELERSNDGRQFSKIKILLPAVNNGNSASYDYIDKMPLSDNNFYRVKAVSQNGLVQYTKVVQVSPLNQDAGFSVFPNPVMDKTMHIRYKDLPAGTYRLKLSNKNGQVVYAGNMQVNASNLQQTITLGNSVAAGSYQLVLLAPDGHQIVQQVIIQ